MNLTDLKARLAEIEVRAKKSLGQNFLVNEYVVEKIVKTVNSASPDHLIEIGPGLGALTESFKDQSLLLIELDKDLAEYWRQRGLSVIEDDALKVNWENLPLPPNTWLASNLPYQISTHLVVDRCFGPAHLAGMVLMFQKEVAQRLTALPRTPAYGVLSVLAQHFWEITKVADAGPQDFFPPPKVSSRVLKLTRSKSSTLDRSFLTFLKAAFFHRRKFLLKNLKSLGDKWDVNGAFESLGLSPKARAEELSPEQFVALYQLSKAQAPGKESL